MSFGVAALRECTCSYHRCIAKPWGATPPKETLTGKEPQLRARVRGKGLDADRPPWLVEREREREREREATGGILAQGVFILDNIDLVHACSKGGEGGDRCPDLSRLRPEAPSSSHVTTKAWTENADDHREDLPSWGSPTTESLFL